MDFARHYHPPELSLWQGRPDTPAGACFFQCVQPLDMGASRTEQTPDAFALLGFVCDEGVRRNAGRTGAAAGPNALRAQLGRLPVHRKDVVVYDAGNVVCEYDDLENAQQALAEGVFRLLSASLTPILIGGGHEMAFGHYQGIVRYLAQRPLTIVNFDAHFDMRPLLPLQKGSSGTPFLQIAMAAAEAGAHFDYRCLGIQPQGNIAPLFQTAQDHRVQVLSADDMQTDSNRSQVFVRQILQDASCLYLSLCLDVFAAAFAPGVSAPQSRGLLPWQVIPLTRQLAASGKVLTYDVAELLPEADPDARTAKLAASMVHDIVHFHQRGPTPR